MIYQKSSYKILSRYIETGKDGIWQRKEKLGEIYEVEYYFYTTYGIYVDSFFCRLLHAMESYSNSYIVGNVICGYHLLFDWHLSTFNYAKC